MSGDVLIAIRPPSPAHHCRGSRDFFLARRNVTIVFTELAVVTLVRSASCSLRLVEWF
jgi:hypothetical protein